MSVSGTPTNPEPTERCPNPECMGGLIYDALDVLSWPCGVCGGSGRVVPHDDESRMSLWETVICELADCYGEGDETDWPYLTDLASLIVDMIDRHAAGRVAARDTLIQAAWADENENVYTDETDLDLLRAVGVYRTGQTPEGNPT